MSRAAIPLRRWAALAAVLASEVVWVGVRFEGVNRDFGGNRWWSPFLAEAHTAVPLALLIVAATLLFGGADLLDAYRGVEGRLSDGRISLVFFTAHLATFGLFVWVTTQVWERGAALSSASDAWVVGWASTALLTAALDACSAVPPRVWLPLLGRGKGALLAGTTVGLAAWWAGRGTLGLWQPLRIATFRLVTGMLGLAVPTTISRPDDFVVGTPGFLVVIYPSCSGFEGIGLVWVFLVAYLWYDRRGLRFPHALLLLPVGVTLIWLANAARIALLILIGAKFSPTVAHGGFHSQGGWLAFLGVSLGLFALARHAPFLRRDLSPDRPARPGNPAAPYLTPFAVLTAVGMLTSAFADGFDRLYALRVVATGLTLYHYRQNWPSLGWSWDWPAFVTGFGVFLVWVGLGFGGPPDTSPNPNPVEAGLMTLPPAWATAWVVFRAAGAVLTVPIAEELAFRGYLMRRLASEDFSILPFSRPPVWAVVVSSVAFGALHGRWLVGTFAGVAYAHAAQRRGRLADAVLAHATTNALLAAWVLATGRWDQW
ncbi:MAG: exosortase E/protease, VPEID-CTERM system [Isosphaeraceae bacterium]